MVWHFVSQTTCDWLLLFIFCITSSLQRRRGGSDLRAVITCCQDCLTWVMVTWNQDGVRKVETSRKQWLKIEKSEIHTYPEVISQMESKSCDVLIFISLISTHRWLSESAFSPPGSLWLAWIHRFCWWLIPLREAKELPLMACFHSNRMGGSGAGEAHRSHFLIKRVLLSLSVFPCAKCKHALN